MLDGRSDIIKDSPYVLEMCVHRLPSHNKKGQHHDDASLFFHYL
ncbi:hypothetical protein ACTXGQ_17130 [Marinobacter sp. 1Y8]